VCTATARAQSPDETAGAAAARKPDLDYITPDAFAAAVVYPRSILQSSRLELLPVEVLSTVCKKELGLDPVEIEQAIVVADPPKALPLEGPPELAVILKTGSPEWHCTAAGRCVTCGVAWISGGVLALYANWRGKSMLFRTLYVGTALLFL